MKLVWKNDNTFSKETSENSLAIVSNHSYIFYIKILNNKYPLKLSIYILLVFNNQP